MDHEQRKKELKKYVESMDIKQLARWMTLIHAQELISRFCKGNEDCITEKTSKIQEYMNARVDDMERYILLKPDEYVRIPSINEFFCVSGTEEEWLDEGNV